VEIAVAMIDPRSAGLVDGISGDSNGKERLETTGQIPW